MNVKEQIEKFQNRKPEIVFEWSDRETGAEGWLVINSLRGGAAGGGTRMRKGLDKLEVLSLAKTMEIKFAICGPDIGGAKSGINFDPADPRKEEVLKKWFAAVLPILKTYYGTGGDLNIDEVKDVIPITSSLGLHHPQEGVLKGHFKPAEGDFEIKIHQLQNGVSLPVHLPKYSPDPARNYTVADLITGWGVSESIRHFYELSGDTLEGKKAIIQGWGNVGAAAGYYLAAAGAKIVGIIDRHGGLLNKEGYSFEEVKGLYNSKRENQLSSSQIVSAAFANETVWDIPADIMVPAAASRLLDRSILNRLKAAGVKLISCGANVPFNDQSIFFGETAEFADEHFSLIPDFIANCGMARTFAYLMNSNIQLTDHAIFEDVSNIIKLRMQELLSANNTQKNLTESAFNLVLGKIS